MNEEVVKDEEEVVEEGIVVSQRFSRESDGKFSQKTHKRVIEQMGLNAFSFFVYIGSSQVSLIM